MIKLDKADYAEALELYRSHKGDFPLIAAVLSGAQDGVVFADSALHPGEIYVEHAFGFSQLFGRPNLNFEAALHRYLLVDQVFFATKVRLYTPSLPEFLRSSQYDRIRSERQRFILDSTDPVGKRREPPCSVELTCVDRKSVPEIERRFGVVNRFWRSSEDFITRSLAVVARREGNLVAICYAAAVADGRAETDVLTLTEFRNQGLGKRLVNRFTQDCLTHGLLPVWDCFTNNAGSMALGRASGFIPCSAPYPFFTINRASPI